ncbi:unnamed protein product [Protopolystoma xenopodis]|uniref:Secreted protein n=1 Tax=Protopolystoma xenopodis TaxID=117903 RepID=A0A448XHX8_9PLAT|nr:unnamed protein product [Protopolystoma xenopodis]
MACLTYNRLLCAAVFSALAGNEEQVYGPTLEIIMHTMDSGQVRSSQSSYRYFTLQSIICNGKNLAITTTYPQAA